MRKHKSRAWVALNMNHLRHNLHTLRDRLPPGCQLMASVKADAYGHGAVAISRELNINGVNAFCVATVMEGVALRKRYIDGEILILGYTHPRQFPLLVRYGLTQTVLDLDYAEALHRFGEALPVHIKVDTGLRRLGERSENLDRILRVFDYKNLNVTGIFTHFCAENDGEAGKRFTREQVRRFLRVRAAIDSHGFPPPKAHVQSSYGLFNHPELTFDYVRVGRALYGLMHEPGGADMGGMTLRPVLSLKARVSAVKTVFTGEYIGYGFSCKASRDMKIAVIAIGYADGLLRTLSGGAGYVLIHGRKAAILGYVCMDQTLVDVTDIETVARGDTAVIIGRSGEGEITAASVAEQAGTSPTEVVSRLGARLERSVSAGRDKAFI